MEDRFDTKTIFILKLNIIFLMATVLFI